MPEFKPDYIFPTYLPSSVGQDFKDIQDNSNVGISLLSTLGSYWHTYYEDMENLHLLSGGITSLVGAEYQALLQQVVSSSIIDTPVHHVVPNQLVAFNSKDASYVRDGEGNLAYIEFKYPGLEGVQYLSEALVSSDVVLCEDDHFDIVDGCIRFYVDIFTDGLIQAHAYTFTSLEISENPQQVVILWASDISLTETYLYDRYGRYLYSKKTNSVAYKATLTALQYFFTNTKSIQSLETILNILFNLPYARTGGETVLSLETLKASGEVVSGVIDYNANALADTAESMEGNGWYTVVTTTHNVYHAPVYAELLVGVGDVLRGYQLICRLHRAKDYISDADWYKDTKFPFELVTDLDDYTVLTTPDEFEQYVPHRCDGSVTMDGTYLSTGVYGIHNGINPFLNTRSKSSEAGGTEFEQLLYGLVDTILKYNLIHVYTELNYDNINYFIDNNIDETYSAIANAVPAYLYPIMETVFHADMADKFEEAAETHTLEIETEQTDLNIRGTGAICDGSVGFGNPRVYFFNGEYYSDGALTCYPYGGEDANYADSETEKDKLQVLLEGQEALSVLGFGETPTFPRDQYYHTFSGLNYADGSVAFSLYEESVEALALGIEVVAEDSIDPYYDSSTVQVEFAQDDHFGGCDGVASFDNVTYLFCGAAGIKVFTLDGKYLADGTRTCSYEIADSSKVHLFDGGVNLSGERTTGWTLGSNVPPYVSPTDSLGVSVNYYNELFSTVEIAGEEEVLLGVTQVWEDTLNMPDSVNELSISRELGDSLGGCDGTVSFNNAERLTCGSEGTKLYMCNGEGFADGVALFSDTIINEDVIPLFDGTYNLVGWETTGWTLGSNVPSYVSVMDTLDITITYTNP